MVKSPIRRFVDILAPPELACGGEDIRRSFDEAATVAPSRIDRSLIHPDDAGEHKSLTRQTLRGFNRRYCKLPHSGNDALERGSIANALADESCPLQTFYRAGSELVAYTDWHRFRKRLPASGERSPDGSREGKRIALKCRRNIPDVEVVIHPTIRHAEIDDGFQLLGDNRLTRVREDPRSGHIQKGWVAGFYRSRSNRIAETAVHS